MAVYTKINKKDISHINKKFKIEKIINFKGIKQGIENTNYLLRSKNKKFILTIFEKRVSQKEIPFFMELMDKLDDLRGFCIDIQGHKERARYKKSFKLTPATHTRARSALTKLLTQNW